MGYMWQERRWGHEFRALGRLCVDFVLSSKNNGKPLNSFKCNQWDQNAFLKDDPVAGKLLEKGSLPLAFGDIQSAWNSIF